MEPEPSQTPECEHPWAALSLIAGPWQPAALVCEECGGRWDMADGDVEERLEATSAALAALARAASTRQAETEQRVFKLERYLATHLGAGRCDFCDTLVPAAAMMAVGAEINVCAEHVADAIGHMLEGTDRSRALRAASIWIHGWQVPLADLRKVRIAAGLAALTGRNPSPGEALECAAETAEVALHYRLAVFLGVSPQTTVAAVLKALAGRLDVSVPQTAAGRAWLITLLCALDRALNGLETDLVDRENPVESLLQDVGVPDPECEFAAAADLLAAEHLSEAMLLSGGWDVLEEAFANLIVAFAQEIFGPDQRTVADVESGNP